MKTEVKVSVSSFLFSVFLAWTALSQVLHVLILLLALLPVLLLPQHRLNSFTASCLGCLFTLGLSHAHYSAFGLYLAVLTFFHFSEYVTTGLGNPQNLSWDSYLINHSYQYWAAMLVSWLEYSVWLTMYPSLKTWPGVTLAGLLVCILGEVIRKLAMLKAGRNFNHLVQSTKEDTHVLVTNGVYSLCRHPSYLGWFLWSVGSQVILVNPLCFVLYMVVSFAFFRERIYVEEYTLVSFFGDQYRDYQARVVTGIPFIQGYHGPVLWGEKKNS